VDERNHISGRERKAVPSTVPDAAIPTTPDFAAAVQPSYVRSVFFGSDGLKAGWGLAFYMAAYYPLQFVASRWAWSWDRGGNWLWPMLLAEVGVLLAAVAPSLALAVVERRPWGAYGLPGRTAFGKMFWVGALWGFGSISLLLAALYGARVLAVGELALHGLRALKFAAFWAGFFLMVGWYEEFLLRGYTQFALTRLIGFWPAAVVLSCVFSLIHLGNAGEQWPGLLAVWVIGFFLCLTLRRTGSLWFAVGFHAAWDWGETFVYSVPDSGTVFPGHLLQASLHGPRWLTGGMVGPEGSLLCFVVIGVAWAGFRWVYPETRSGAPSAYARESKA